MPPGFHPFHVLLLGGNCASDARDGRDLHMLDIIISIFTDPGFAKGFFGAAVDHACDTIGAFGSM